MRIMSLPIALQVILLVTKESLNLQVASKSVKSFKNSSKYEMDRNSNLSRNGIFVCELDSLM